MLGAIFRDDTDIELMNDKELYSWGFNADDDSSSSQKKGNPIVHFCHYKGNKLKAIN
jgi:hypothetical protein